MVGGNLTRKPVIFFVVLFFIFTSLQPAAPETKKKPGEGFNLLSEKQEIELGRAAAAQVEKDLPVLSDSGINAYVANLGRTLVNHSQRQNLPYSFKVVNSAEVNAFALPGGFVYVHRGILDQAQNESEVAGVLAHEISHVVAKHSAKQASKFMALNFGASALELLFGNKGGAGRAVSELAASFVAQQAFLKFSRDAEREADRLGVQNMYAAGFDPHGMITLFEKLRELRERDPSKVEIFFSSHPSPKERIENVSTELSTFPEKRWRANSRDFASIKSSLKTLPPPPKPQKRR